MRKIKCFTLAEVLIVIGVIGIVSAITIPSLIAFFQEKAAENRKEVIEDRLIQGMNQLNTLDDGFNASQYTNTEGFVRALSRHYKMNQICGAEDLGNCFSYNTFNYTKKDDTKAVKNLDNLKTPEDFGLKSNEYYAPAGFISSGGTSFIMLLKKDCIMDTGENMRSIPTNCVQYFYNNNGANNPNELGKDIEYSKNAQMSIKTDGDGILTSPINGYRAYLIPKINYNTTNLSSAQKTCSDNGYDLPTKEELQELYCHSEGRTNQFYDCENTTKDNNLAKAIATKAVRNGYFWSSSPYGSNKEYKVYFQTGGAIHTGVSGQTGGWILCLSK